jgi:hypothetical protein
MLPLQGRDQILALDKMGLVWRMLLQMKDYSVGDELTGFALWHVDF